MQATTVAGTEVGSVTAIDRDGPPFNRFTYSLLPSSDHVQSAAFVVDRDSGTIRTTRALDRERRSVYRLTAVARELAHPRASSTADVTVFVADRNDNAPVIVESNHSAVVSLYAAPGHVFARVAAADADWGLNARLRYSIIGGDEPSAAGAFDVGVGSGLLSVRRDLSDVLPAHVTRLSLDVLVRDSGVPPLNASASLTVVVDRSSASRDRSRHGTLPAGRGGDVGGDWLTSLGGELRREFLILLAAGTVAVVVILLLAIVCVRRRQQLAALAAGGVDQVEPRRDRDDAKCLPAIVEVGWSSDADATLSCRDPDFQIVRNIVDSSRRRDALPWKASTLQSPSRVMSDDFVTTSTTPYVNTTGRQQTTPQLQTFSVSSTCLLINFFDSLELWDWTDFSGTCA